MTRLTKVLLATTFALLVPGAPALAQTPEELAGVWMRQKTASSGPQFYRLEPDGEGGVKGEMLTPPQGMTCRLELGLDARQLVGTAVFEEPDYDPLVTRWEFSVSGGELKGRSEWVSWDDEGKESRGWEQHTLVRAQRVGLVTEGNAEEAPFGDPVEPLASLTGGWSGPGGGWALKVDGAQVSLKPVGHSPEVLITLQDERGILRGHATLSGGVSCDVELAFDDGRLNGRCSWLEAPELGDRAGRGWSPISFGRLDRQEAGPEGVAGDEAPAAGDGSLLGVWRRDDGLYLRVREQSGEVIGVLSAATGEARARLRFRAEGGVWKGTANWGAHETQWELAVGEGGLTGRAEWVDLYEGQVVARGWAGRTFNKLTRIR